MAYGYKKYVDARELRSMKEETKGYGYTVTATVKGIKGRCEVGYKVGDKIVFDGLSVNGKICSGALATIVPTLYAFMWGAEFPWDEDKDVTTVPCVDEQNQVVFELKRDRQHPWYTRSSK